MSCEVEAPMLQPFFKFFFKKRLNFQEQLYLHSKTEQNTQKVPYTLPIPTFTIPLSQASGMWVHKLGLPVVAFGFNFFWF